MHTPQPGVWATPGKEIKRLGSKQSELFGHMALNVASLCLHDSNITHSNCPKSTSSKAICLTLAERAF